MLLIEYLRTMGFEVTNEPFENNSWFFRNALVRANYTNYEVSVRPTLEPLMDFLENAMLGTHHPLFNRKLHVDYVEPKINEPVEAASHVTDQVTDQVSPYVYALLMQLKAKPKSASQLLKDMGLSHRHNFRKTYLNPALEAHLIERTIPDNHAAAFSNTALPMPEERPSRSEQGRSHDYRALSRQGGKLCA